MSYKKKVHDLLGQPWDNNFNAKTYEFPWLSNVNSILDDLVMSYIWINQNPQNSEWLANTVLQKSRDQYKQLWLPSVNESTQCVNYRIFKTEHRFKNYKSSTYAP